MSSGNMPRASHPDLFLWSEALDVAGYLHARYRVGSIHDGDATAMAMAMEQSAATTHIRGHVTPAMLQASTIRVVSVREHGVPATTGLAPYYLETEVYAEGREGEQDFLVDLAIPLQLLAGKPAQIWNVVVGEIPRLGFLTRFQLVGLSLPAGFGPGPAFGVAGIRERLGVARGPVLCRSMRPAVGLDRDTMAHLNQDVLSGGFHMVKDDELQVFADDDAFRAHVQAMVAARDAAAAASGERKAYLANLICEPGELEPRWRIACEAGADAVLVAPAIQGLGVLSQLARQRRLPVLAHNTFSDLLSRHDQWGIEHGVLSTLYESLGADWVVTSGEYGALDGAGMVGAWPFGRPQRAMPILQGGKMPAGLPAYRAAIGGDDYMLIVASWVDGYPDGLAAGARAFRDAVDAQAAA
jgi:ribulose 1,5-bisphosphate carboxylase large subunit-like protein